MDVRVRAKKVVSVVVRFLDKPVQTDSGVFARSSAVCASTQPFLPKHFPGFPIVPGVLIVDTCFETICEAASKTGLVGPNDHLEIDRLDSFKFRHCVFPEDAMEVACKLRDREDSRFTFNCVVSVDGEDRSKGRMTLRTASGDANDSDSSQQRNQFSEQALRNWEWYQDFEVQRHMDAATAKFIVAPNLFAQPEALSESDDIAYPTVLLIEGLAQASVRLTDEIRPANSQTTFGMVYYAQAIGTAHINDQVDFELLVQNPDPEQFRVRGRAFVEGEMILETEVVLGFTPLSGDQIIGSDSVSPTEPIGVS